MSIETIGGRPATVLIAPSWRGGGQYAAITFLDAYEFHKMSYSKYLKWRRRQDKHTPDVDKYCPCGSGLRSWWEEIDGRLVRMCNKCKGVKHDG